MSIKPLPPLKSLVAFEAAARFQSFTLAASDLNVTQSAISKQIKYLEDYLGQELFIRENRNLTLTDMGASYYLAIQQSLHSISKATKNALREGHDPKITIVTTNAMASYWLLPKYANFKEQHPELDLRIIAADSLKALSYEEFDLALYYAPVIPEGLHATPLFNEEVFPVCSPSYLAQHPELSTPESLCETTLLEMNVSENWITWQDWFSQSKMEDKYKPKNLLKLNNYLLVIQAALTGQGIALGWGNLVDDYLESNLLVRPIENSLRTKEMFYILEPDHPSSKKIGINRSRDWILSLLKGN